MTDRLPHLVLDALATAHWAISEDALRTMFAVAYRKAGDLEAIAAQLGRPLDHAYAVEVRDGVARLPIRGPMFRYANLFSLVSGATSYELIARDLTVAMQDPAVRAVVLDLDSPGGEVNGCAELAELIASYRGRKPLVGYVSGTGASAAYWLATACDEVVCADTAILGSLGVRMALLDTRARDRAAGVEEIEIVSSQTPRKQDDDPTTDTGRAAVQATVDALAAVFIAAVARYRGVPETMVLADYGQGGVFVGEAAVLAGLADRLGTYETLHAALAAGAQRSASRPALTALQETRMTEPAARRPDGPVAAFTEGAEVTSRVTRDVIVETRAAGLSSRSNSMAGASLTVSSTAIVVLLARLTAWVFGLVNIPAFDVLDREEARIAALVQSGTITEEEGRRRVLALERERLPGLLATRQALDALQQATQDPAVVDALQQQIDKIDELARVTQQTQGVLTQLGVASRDALESGLASGLTGVLNQTKTLGDVWRDTARSVLDAVNQIIARLIALQIQQAIVNAASSLLGFSAGGEVPAPVRRATGGYITGPGSATSDSILARLSAGEFVMRAAAVRAYGVDFFEALNGLRAPNPPRRRASVPRFAEGGLVGGSAAGGETSLVVGLEDGLVTRKLETTEGTRSIIRVIERNANTIRRALRL